MRKMCVFSVCVFFFEVKKRNHFVATDALAVSALSSEFLDKCVEIADGGVLPPNFDRELQRRREKADTHT